MAFSPRSDSVGNELPGSSYEWRGVQDRGLLGEEGAFVEGKEKKEKKNNFPMESKKNNFPISFSGLDRNSIYSPKWIIF